MSVLVMIAMGLIALAALFALFRLVFGPSTADRIVSTDALSLIATIVLIFLSQVFQSSLYLDIALIYAILSFVGIVALARTIDTNPNDSEEDS